MAKALSPLDISYHYIQKFFTTYPTVVELKETTMEICNLLKAGWTDKELWMAIERCQTRVPIPNLVDGLHMVDENILHKEHLDNPAHAVTFYYHNLLRVSPSPNIVQENGELIDKGGEFFLEMRASYTLNQMAKYYIAKFKIPEEEAEIKRIVGSLKWVIKHNGVDLTLYMIDAYARQIEEEDKLSPQIPTDITKAKDEAKVIYDSKRAQAQESGDDKFVPRKRTLKFDN